MDVEPNIMTALVSTLTPPSPPVGTNLGEVRPSEAITLKRAFEELVTQDSRCVGLARYIANVRIFWSYSIPTACAGHGFIFFNPDFYNRIPEQTRISVCVHEVWHLILKHLDRGKGCDPYTHNAAADHVINIAMGDDGFTFEGTEPLRDTKFRGMSTEAVYNAIYERDQNKPQSLKAMDGHIPAELIEDLIEQVLEDEDKGVSLDDQKKSADKDVENASMIAGNNTSSTGIKLELTNVRHMIVGATYHDIFKPYLTDPLSGGARTFMRPNRRSHAMRGSNLILPGRFPKRGRENRLTHLTYALDVSGSISQKMAQQFHESVRTIKELLNPAKLTVLFFDTRIKLEKTFTDKERYGEIHVSAGGGTCLKDVWKRTEALGSDALVIFTDLCVTIPPKPSWECIWLVPETRYNVPTNIHGEVYLIPETK
jgi:predicted metal-dependent peptidase